MRVRAGVVLAIGALLAPGAIMAGAAAPADQAELGRATYTNCAACHGASGQGGFAPPFVANPDLKDAPAAIAHIVGGSVNMPPFGGQLSAAEIAAVLNYVRNSWGNRADLIGAADVAAVEGRLAAARQKRN